MTNKPMLSVDKIKADHAIKWIFDHYPDTGGRCKVSEALRDTAKELRAILDKPIEVTSEDVLRWMDEHAAVQRKAVPVACLIRSRNIITQASIAVDGKDHFSSWSEWEPSSLEYGQAVTDPRRNDPVCYEIELLFKEQPAPVAVVMPERMADTWNGNRDYLTYDKGWNDALAEVARLNGVKP